MDTFCRLLLNTTRRFAYPFAPALSRGLGVPLTAVTSLIAANQITGILALLFGPLGDRWGYTAEEVIGRMSIRKIYPEGMAKKVMKMMRSLGYGGVGKLTSYTMVYVRQDGEILEGNLSAAIIYEEPSPGKFILSA